MINFLVECSMCKSNSLLSVIYIVKRVMDVVFIVIPIVLIVLLIIDMAKNVVAAKEDDIKKNKGLAIRRCIYAVGIFMIPAVVNVVMSVLYTTVDDGSEQSFFACWTNATLDNVKSCNKEAEINEKLADEKKKEESDTKKENAINEIKESMKAKQGLQRSENKSESGNSSNNSSNGNSGGSSSIDDGKGDTSSNYTIFVGDSRMVGVQLYNTTSQNEKFIAKESMGVIWLDGTAYLQIVDELKKHSNANIIVNIGVNDAASESTINNRIKAYQDFCKRILSRYPDSRLIITNVGPVDESVANCKVTNAQINNFNKLLSSAISETVGDTGKKAKYCETSYDGYKTSDCLHYTVQYYQNNVYPELKKCLNN